MKKTVAIGEQDFAKLRENDYFYIDKTGFIREWWEAADTVTLLTRPRRFGKTLNMNMLDCFFSNKYADRGDLFEGLEIWKEEKYRKLQGTYPVIFLSFAGVKFVNYENTRSAMNGLITDLYHQYVWMLEEPLFDDADREAFREIRRDMPDDVAARSLYHLSEWLCRYYGKKCILILDEYDTPMQEAYVHEFWEELTAYIRALFNNAFKTNPYMERAIMTGVTRVSKESIFSDLNNLNVVTTTTEKYMTAFGFTEKEVFDALDEYGLSDQKKYVKKWYDGFTFGTERDIYNPWSITKYLDEKKFAPYWANTSSNSLVGTLIRQGNKEIKRTMESLLMGGSIETAIDEELSYNQLDGTDESIWSLLLASGYLRIDGVETRGLEYESEEFQVVYRLKLTNFEVKNMFQRMIAGWFRRSNVPYNQFVHAMLSDNLREMNIFLNEILLETISSFDGAGKPSDKVHPERFYHGLVLGLIATEGKYEVRSNGESGYGRYDIMMVPKRIVREQGECLPSFVMEFKIFNDKDPDYEKSLEDTVRRALAQIQEKAYDTALLTQGIPAESIRHYGFGFEGKKVLIGTET